MTGKEFKYVLDTIENEGFDYTFTGYTDFKKEVKDTEFHNLRRAYLSARNDLSAYVGHDEFSVTD